jgi:hypothetical protein
MERNSSPQEVATALHQIVDAASALMTNVEILAGTATPAQLEIVEEVRGSARRIAELARAVRAAVEGKKVDSAKL